MKVSHILYKVEDLETAVKEWREKGFIVENGISENPYNALIYFSEGPYIELFQNANMPNFVKLLLRLFGHKAMVERLNAWETSDDGLIALCLENYEDNLDKELKLLKKNNIKCFKTTSKRLDTKGRLLKFKVAFPNQLTLPFLMTYFNIDPKPKNFIHPNGAIEVEHISFGTYNYESLIKELCDDPILKIYEGKGLKNLVIKIE